MVCHGADAVGGGVVPDLRRSGTLASAELWDDIVHKGSLSKQGMISFAPVLSAEEIQNIRGYVINRAKWGKETQGQFAGTKKNSAGGGASGASK